MQTRLEELEAENEKLRRAIKTVQNAAKQLEASLTARGAWEQKILRSLAATERSEVLKELEETKHERDLWNFRATELELELERVRGERGL